MPSNKQVKIQRLLSRLPQTTVEDPNEIKQIVDFINNNNDFANNSDASWLMVGHCGFIKCFSPSLDYPCIPHPYYLYPPFTLFWTTPLNRVSQNLYLPTPNLKCLEQHGEKDNVLTAIRESLIRAIMIFHKINLPAITLD